MSWELWRQDEHGNEFLIREFEDRSCAEGAREVLVGRGHHQHYWVTASRSVGTNDRDASRHPKAVQSLGQSADATQDLLDSIQGALERTEEGRKEAQAGRGVPLKDLPRLI